MIELNKEKIKKLLSEKRKDTAILILKINKLREKRIETVQTFLLTVEQLVTSLLNLLKSE